MANSSKKDQDRSMGDVPEQHSAEVKQDVAGYARSKYPYQKHYYDVTMQAVDTSTSEEDREAIAQFASEQPAAYDINMDPDITPNEGDHDTPNRMGVNYPPATLGASY